MACSVESLRFNLKLTSLVDRSGGLFKTNSPAIFKTSACASGAETLQIGSVGNMLLGC